MIITIEGMHSAECERRVRFALQEVDGLQVREVRMGAAVVDGDDEQLAGALLAIDLAGYQPHIAA